MFTNKRIQTKTCRHIVVRLLKTKTNKNLKRSFRIKDITFKVAGLTADFPTEIMEIRR